MSTTGEEAPPEFSPIDVAMEEGGIGALTESNLYDAFSQVSTLGDWTTEIENWLRAQSTNLGADVTSLMTDVQQVVTDSIDSGFMPYSAVGPFFRSLYWDYGVENVNLAMLNSGQLSSYMALYGLQQGYITQAPTSVNALSGPVPVTLTPPTPSLGVPGTPPTGAAPSPQPLPKPAPVTYPTATPPATPSTPGGTVVKEYIKNVTVVQVQDKNLSADVNNAVSAAMQAETQIITQLIGSAVDQALGGLQPGQVKTALARLNQASRQVAAQLQAVVDIQNEFPPAGTAAELAGIQLQLESLQATISELQTAIAAEVPADLPTLIANIEAQVKTNTSDIAEIVGTTVPLLASATQNLTSVVGGIDSKLTQDIEPELATLKSETLANTTKLNLTTDDCLAALCDGENNVINPIKNGGATPSLLRQLGGLLGRAFEIGFLATLADVAVTVLDAKLSLAAVVSDTETLASWATDAASTAAGDLSWAGGAYVVS